MKKFESDGENRTDSKTENGRQLHGRTRMNEHIESTETTRREYTKAIAALGAIGAGGLAGCTGTFGGDDGGGEQVVALHGWTGGDGADAVGAFEAALGEAHPDLNAELRGIGGESNQNLDTVVAKRLQNDDPPSAFAGWPGKNLQKYEGVLADGEEGVWEEAGLKDAHVAEVTEACQINGNWAAVPIGSHRMNDLFYNPAVLDDAGIDPEGIASMDDLMAAMDAVAENTDAAPWAHAMKGAWTITQLVPWVMMSQNDVDTYTDWIGGDGDEDAIRGTLETVRTMQEEYTTGDASSIGFTEAAQKILDGEAAFQHQGNWVAGTYKGEGATYDEDWGSITFPGTEGIYGFHLDSFIYPAGNPTPEGTETFLQFVGSEAAHVQFNQYKGSIPTREVPTEEFGPYLTSTIEEFNAADRRPPTLQHGLALDPGRKADVGEAINQNMSDPYDIDAATEALMSAVQ